MAFLHLNTHFQIDLSPTEIFDISQEISREFDPRILPDFPAPLVTGELSQQELLAISEEISLGYAPVLSSPMLDLDCPIKLSPIEIREISEMLSAEFTPKAAHNVSQVVLLPVDPNHLYVYWNLAEQQLEPTLKAGKTLILRVFSDIGKISGENGENGEKRWFDVEIDSSQAQKKLPLPQQNAQISYSAVLGKRDRDNNLAILTYSNVVDAPFKKLIIDQSNGRTVPSKPVSQLSKTSGKTINNISKTASGQSNIEP